MKRISRKELFEAAWSRPMLQVAVELGVTSTALKKTCDRHDIPTPARGHWAKAAAGRGPPTPSLPRVAEAELEHVTIYGGSPVPLVAREAQRRALAAIENVQVAASAPERERTDVSVLRKALASAKPDTVGFLRISKPGLIPIVVSPASVERALTWIGSFLQFAAAQGLEFRSTAAELIVDGEPVRFRIEERTTRTPHVPTPKELSEKKRRADWGYSSNWTPWPKYDHCPSGQLSLIIDSNSFSGLRRTFADGRTQSLEGLLPEILGAFAAHAAGSAVRRREIEAARLQAATAQARRERLKAFDEREDRRIKFGAAVSLALAERAHLQSVEKHLQESTKTNEGPEGMTGWVQRRMAELDALISPQFMALSAQYAMIDFDEGKSAAAISEHSWRYTPGVELRFWKIDDEVGQASSQSAYEWSRDAGLIHDVESLHTQGEDGP